MKIETDPFSSASNLSLSILTSNTSNLGGNLGGNVAEFTSPPALDFEEELSIIEQLRRNISQYRFRDWTLLNNVDFKLQPIGNNDVINSADADLDLNLNGNQNRDFELKDEQDEFAMTDSMLTFFQGSAILLLAAVVIILIVVICQKIYRNHRAKKLKSKKVLYVQNAFIYPVQSIHIPIGA